MTRIILRQARLRPCAHIGLLIGTLLLAGCSTLVDVAYNIGLTGSKKEGEPAAQDLESINAGYVIIHQFVSTQKNSGLLLMIKRESDDVQAVIDDISRVAAGIDKQIEAFAKQDPTIKLDRVVLPKIEREQRDSAQRERAKQLLESDGKAFERLLLLTQSGVLTTERHISRAMVQNEKNPERNVFWRETQQQFDRLYASVMALLEAQYYSK